MATGAPSTPDVPENLLKEIQHHLNDSNLTAEEVIAAHDSLESEKITTGMPQLFGSEIYVNKESGELKGEKVRQLSETIANTRRLAVEALEDAQRWQKNQA